MSTNKVVNVTGPVEIEQRETMPNTIDRQIAEDEAFNARVLATEAPFAREFATYLRGRIKFGRPTEALMDLRPERQAGPDYQRDDMIVSLWGDDRLLAAVKPRILVGDQLLRAGESVGEAIAALPNPGSVQWVAVKEGLDALRLYRVTPTRFDLQRFIFGRPDLRAIRAATNGAAREQYIDADGRTPLCLVHLPEEDAERASWYHGRPVTERLFCGATFNGGALVASEEDGALVFQSSFRRNCPDALIDEYLTRPGVVFVPDDGGPGITFGAAEREIERRRSIA